MGGFNEDVINGENKGGVVVEDILQGQKTINRSQSSLQLIPDQVQTVRHHVSGKNVHFHVDDENLKLSIPVAQLSVKNYQDARTSPNAVDFRSLTDILKDLKKKVA